MGEPTTPPLNPLIDMLHFRLIIVLPDRLSNDIFKLPCVVGVNKNRHNEPVYLLAGGVTTTQGIHINSVGAGNILAEDDVNRWWCLSLKENNAYLKTAVRTP